MKSLPLKQNLSCDDGHPCHITKMKKNIAEDRNRGRKGDLIKIDVAFQDDFINFSRCSLSDYGSNMEHALLVGSHTWKITWDYHDQSFLWWCEFSLFCECFWENFGKTCIKKLFDNVFWILETMLLSQLLFTILRPFGTKESIGRKVDHGGQIVLWYWQHATNLAKATMFVVCTSSARVLMWVRGRVKQKRSLTFCVFGQIRNKCFSSSTFPKL